MAELTIIPIPKAINGHRSIFLVIRTPSIEDVASEAFLDIHVYEKSANDSDVSDLEGMEILGNVISLCQDENDPDKRLYIRAFKDVSGLVDDEIFLPTGEGYPVILAGASLAPYTSDDIDDDILDIYPKPYKPDIDASWFDPESDL